MDFFTVPTSLQRRVLTRAAQRFGVTTIPAQFDQADAFVAGEDAQAGVSPLVNLDPTSRNRRR